MNTQKNERKHNNNLPFTSVNGNDESFISIFGITWDKTNSNLRNEIFFNF